MKTYGTTDKNLRVVRNARQIVKADTTPSNDLPPELKPEESAPVDAAPTEELVATAKEELKPLTPEDLKRVKTPKFTMKSRDRVVVNTKVGIISPAYKHGRMTKKINGQTVDFSRVERAVAKVKGKAAVKAAKKARRAARQAAEARS